MNLPSLEEVKMISWDSYPRISRSLVYQSVDTYLIMDSQSDVPQSDIVVVEVSSDDIEVADLACIYPDIWFVFIGDVTTETKILNPRKGQKEGKKLTVKAAVILIEREDVSVLRRNFRVQNLRVFVPYESAGFTNSMFIPMNYLSDYVKKRLATAKTWNKDANKEIEALKKEFEISLESKLEILVETKFFDHKDFDVKVVIQPRKDFAVFAFITFYQVTDYDMGLASMTLLQQTWEMLLPQKVYIETRFSKAQQKK